MHQSPTRPMSQTSTLDDITTINYSLHWPHLENPSNNTFVGHTQIDICRCPRPDLPPQDDVEPGHIYTRYECVGPEVKFKSGEDELWVLHEAHGPINVLRPATAEEADRRKQIHDDADPTSYQGHNFILLTGPCPRGRYQAHATQMWLQGLGTLARQNVSSLSLLIQPYEEDCSIHLIKGAYSELANYILDHVSGLKALYLYICNDGWSLLSAATEFSIIFDLDDVKIVLRDNRSDKENRDCKDARAFLELVTKITETRPIQAPDPDREEDAVIPVI